MNLTEKICLGCILILAFIIRIWGLNWGLPYPFHPDEGTIIFRAMAFGSGDLNPHFFRWPSLPMYIMFFVYGSSYVIGNILGIFAGAEDFLRLYIENPTFFWILGRSMSVVSALVTILFVFLIGRKLYSIETGLIASLFLSVVYLHVRDSHYCTPDVLLTLLMTISFWFIIAIAEKRDVKSYLLAGLFAGLATSTKYVGGATICLTIFLVFLRNMIVNPGRETIFRETRYLLVSAAVAILAFGVGTPFSLLDYKQFLNDVLIQAVMVEPNASEISFFSTYFQGLKRIFLVIFWNGLGPSLFVLSLFGMLASFLGKRKSDLLLWCYWLPYMLVFSIFSIHRATYFTPVLPISCLFAASFVSSIGPLFPRLVNTEKKRKSLAYGLVGVAFICSGFQCIKFNYIITMPDTRTLAKEWIESNIPENSIILKEAFTPVLNKTAVQLARFIEDDTVEHESWSKTNRWKNTLEYNTFKDMHPQYNVYDLPSYKSGHLPGNGLLASPISFIRDHQIEYVIVSSKSYLSVTSRSFDELKSEYLRDRYLFYQWLDTDGKMLMVFRGKCELPIIDNPEGFTFHNPVIKIYKI